MEDALVPNKELSDKEKINTVLILVLMEDALALQLDGEMNGDWQESLNPCCNGRCTRTGLKYIREALY